MEVNLTSVQTVILLHILPHDKTDNCWMRLLCFQKSAFHTLALKQTYRLIQQT